MESIIIHKSDAERLLVRLPREVKDFIEREAAYNGASQNSEIIRAIRLRMDNRQPERTAS
jgi:Arc-like DNA binding domain